MFVNKKRSLRLVEIGITICINGLLRHPECMDVFHFPLTHQFLSKGYVSYRCSNMTVRAKHTDTPKPQISEQATFLTLWCQLRCALLLFHQNEVMPNISLTDSLLSIQEWQDLCWSQLHCWLILPIFPLKSSFSLHHLHQSTKVKDYHYPLPSRKVTYKITVLYSDPESLGYLEYYRHNSFNCASLYCASQIIVGFFCFVCLFL